MRNQYQKSLCYLWVFLAISCLMLQCSMAKIEKIGSDVCDLFTGSWVVDDNGTMPLYNSSQCPYLVKEFDCQGNGRPDQLYLKYKWKPSACDLPRFDAQDFLERFKGKKIMFVGDSLSSNQYQSLKCILNAASPNSKYTSYETDSLSTFTLEESNITIVLNHSPFLVDLVNYKNKRVLEIDTIKINGKAWQGMDMMIFNTYHWWNHRGKLQSWDFIKMGKKLYKDMDRTVAYKTALATWAKWVDSNINPETQTVFYQTVSPTHFSGGEWGQPGATCTNQTSAIEGSRYPSGTPDSDDAVQAVKDVIREMKTKVGLLDITRLSQLRKDGHPSVYGSLGGSDCSHWCLAGVPDTWNQLLYALILYQHSTN